MRGGILPGRFSQARAASHVVLPSPPLSLLTSAAGRPQTGFTYADIPLMDETGEL